MTAINPATYASRWVAHDGSPSGLEVLGLYAAIGEFITNAALAEQVTRKIARDILRNSDLVAAYKKTPYRDAPLSYFENSSQVVGEEYREPRFSYASLFRDSSAVLVDVKPRDPEGEHALRYLTARFNDAEYVRVQRNSFAHGPVLWFSGHDAPVSFDRRRRHERDDLGRDISRAHEQLSLVELRKSSLLANYLGYVGAEAVISIIWPESYKGLLVPDRALCLIWPPDGSGSASSLGGKA
jgi:hypothetical protein